MRNDKYISCNLGSGSVSTHITTKLTHSAAAAATVVMRKVYKQEYIMIIYYV